MLSPFKVSPSPCLYVSAHPPGIPVHWGIKPPQDQGPPLPFMPDKGILCYICSWSHRSLHVYSLVGGSDPWSPGKVWPVGTVAPAWDCKSSSSFNPFSSSSLGTPRSVQWLASSIHLHTCQTLAEPIRTQLYLAPVNKHFPTSPIVSGFGDCI